ncbi:hypothetical protein D3C71_1726270 [compost metagenome]
MEHQGLHRGGAPDIAIQPFLQFVGTGRAQDHHAPLPGPLQPPLERGRHPLPAAHQHHRRLGVRGRPGLQVADLVVAVARILQGLGTGRSGQAEQQDVEQRREEAESLVHVDLPEQNASGSASTLCQRKRQWSTP